jgi:hypothetical protein
MNTNVYDTAHDVIEMLVYYGNKEKIRIVRKQNDLNSGLVSFFRHRKI